MEKDDITMDDIRAIDDYSDCFDYAEKLGIGMDGLDTVEEMKERLTMAFQKCQPNFINYKEKICREMKDIRRDDKNKGEKLLELLNKTQSKLVKEDPDAFEKIAVIHEALQKENVVANLLRDINMRQQWLQSNECCFVVAGETSAGKSLFLNLLLGEEVLPSHHLPCTSVITRLQYGKTRRARIVYHEPERDPLILNDVTADDIRQSIFEKDLSKRESTSDIKEVQIFLPSKILENGLVLIDSPGIGENDGMDTVIETFVDTNQVMGFIYIIKSDNGGGVDEDRLIKLMKIILEKEKSKGEKRSYRFNPSCAMFICNIWDKVTEPDIVYDHIVKRLGKIWPQFDEEKLVTFSTQSALRETKEDSDYIIEDYKKVLKDLRDIKSLALDSLIKTTYSWIKTILTRSAHHVRTIVYKLTTDQYKLRKNLNEANTNLNELKNKSADVISKLRNLINEKTGEICNEFHEYLSRPVVKMTVRQWIPAELPSEKDEDGQLKDWETIKCELDGLIYDRIADELNKWEEDIGRISNVEAMIESEINAELSSLKNEIEEIESSMSDKTRRRSSVGEPNMSDKTSHRTSLEESNMSDKTSRRTSVGELNMSDRTSRRISIVPEMSNAYKRGSFCIGNLISSTNEQPIHISVVAKNKINKPFRKLRKMFPGKNKLQMYKENGIKYATERSDKLLTQFLKPQPGEEDQLRNVIITFMEGANEFLDRLILKIPRSIDANMSVLNHVSTFQKDAISARRVYEGTMHDLEELKRLLGYYGTGYIFIDDFKPNELHILDPTDKAGRSSAPFKIANFLSNLSSSQTSLAQPCPRGLWAAYQKGLLRRENRNESVSIKVYLPSCKMEKHVKEIAKLRLIGEHKNIASFLGIQNSDSYYPALVYREHLNTLRTYSLKRSGKIDTPRLLEECGSALDFLHCNGLVHMELNINTIMINKAGSISLTGGCLPRTADLPENPEQHIIGDFVYLSPEVLKGDLYTASADVYAFGLLFYDLIANAPAFARQRQTSLDLFVQNINSDKGIKPDIDQLNFDDNGKRVIASCLDRSEGSRPTLFQVREKIAQMDEEHCFDLIEASHNPPVFVKRIDYGRV